GAVLGQQDQRLDEHAVEPVRVLLEFSGEDLGLLVGQRDRAGVHAAVLEGPLQRVAADLAVVALDLQVVQGVRAEDGDVVLVGKAAPGGQFEVVKDEVVVGQILAEALDRPRLAVILRSPDSMDDRHGDYFLASKVTDSVLLNNAPAPGTPRPQRAGWPTA